MFFHYQSVDIQLSSFNISRMLRLSIFIDQFLYARYDRATLPFRCQAIEMDGDENV